MRARGLADRGECEGAFAVRDCVPIAAKAPSDFGDVDELDRICYE